MKLTPAAETSRVVRIPRPPPLGPEKFVSETVSLSPFTAVTTAT